jgi:hypothetical protein
VWGEREVRRMPPLGAARRGHTESWVCVWGEGGLKGTKEYIRLTKVREPPMNARPVTSSSERDRLSTAVRRDVKQHNCATDKCDLHAPNWAHHWGRR